MTLVIEIAAGDAWTRSRSVLLALSVQKAVSAFSPNHEVPSGVISSPFWSQSPSLYDPPHLLARLIPDEIDAFPFKVIGERPSQYRD